VTRAEFSLHDFVPALLPELADLWVESWQATMPAIDFEGRRAWLVDHLSALQSSGVQIVCAFDVASGAMAGFVTIDTRYGNVDQLTVKPAYWGAGAAEVLLDEAKGRSPQQIQLEVNQDNLRAVHFYEKHGFSRDGESVNPRSGLKTWRYRWRASLRS
jgi:putative acetyltransferase